MEQIKRLVIHDGPVVIRLNFLKYLRVHCVSLVVFDINGDVCILGLGHTSC